MNILNPPAAKAVMAQKSGFAHETITTPFIHSLQSPPQHHHPTNHHPPVLLASSFA
jgi:hypothetical protein